MKDLIRANPGLTAAEIAALVSSDHRTYTAMSLADINAYLLSTGIKPTMLLTYESPDIPVQLRAVLVAALDLLSSNHIENLHTERVDFAEATWAILQALVSAGIATQEQITGLYQLGGGLRFAGVTEQSVADLQAEILFDDTLDQLNSKFSDRQVSAMNLIAQARQSRQPISWSQIAAVFTAE